jgi:hypothetical protein
MAASNAPFFTEHSEAHRYTILEVIGKGSYGVVASAIDNTNGASRASWALASALLPVGC